MTARMPSVHSCETGSNSPYSRPMGTDLGLSTGVLTLTWPSDPRSAMSDSARASTRYAEVLAANGMPTIIRPCRTKIISCNSSTLARNDGTGCSPNSSDAVHAAPRISS
eukprot:scaffold10193_cov107-Isochrysis_galbana.AAC.4